MMSHARPILITGGAGMLAGALHEALKAREQGPIFCLDRKSLDLADQSRLKPWFEQNRPGIIFNCAAYTKVDLAEKEPDAADACNGYAVGALAALCRAYDCALIHFSTDYVFEGLLRRPLRPDDPVGPQSAYGRSKLLGERLIQETPPPRWLIIRTAWLYGPGGPNFVQTMLNVARAGKPLRVVNDQVGSPTYTPDLAQAAVELMQREASGIWHICNAGETTWFDFARAIFQEWELHPDLEPIASAEWKAARPDSAIRPAYSVLDLEPFRQLAGRPMRAWPEALRDFKRVTNGSGS
jgi:dTDP-4-dehydrorhamnose reductase